VKIFVAIDESPCSEKAIREVAERFETPNTTVSVMVPITR